MEKLIDILKKETKSLKLQYLEKTKEWATNRYNLVSKRYNWDEKDWCKYLGIEPEVKNKNTSIEFLGFPRGFYNTKNSRILDRLQKETILLKRLGLDKYLEKEKKSAEDHYEKSILKLADRIEKKDLDISKLRAETSHVGVNINTTLTDGVKTVKAQTILAYGPVQKPHYRYLVK